MDTEARSQFIENTEHNYSVIAPAGVGKTQSIVKRVARFVGQARPHDPGSIPKLVVVTYTRKAAAEIKDRVHRELMEQELADYARPMLDHAFFGTTHSFCLSLIKEWGHLAGLPITIDALEPAKEDAFFSQFIQQAKDLTQLLPVSISELFFRCMDFWSLIAKAPFLPESRGVQPVEFADTFFQLDSIWGYAPESKASARKIEESKAALAAWLDDFKSKKPCVGLPEFYSGSDASFQNIFQAALKPFHNWISVNAIAWLQRVKAAYLEYKLSLGVVSYDDMIELGVFLLSVPRARTAIQSQNYHIILDEAQDATRAQFKVLLGVLGVDIDRLNTVSACLPKGQFCMVGDPQQAIYGLGRDLPAYLMLHKKLNESAWAHALYFRTTFRCDHNIVSAVNTFFPCILKEQDGKQAQFEQMSARNGAAAGHVSKYVLSIDTSAKSIQEKALAEAKSFAIWLAQQTPAELGASSWDEIAVLCPRNDWMPVLTHALEGQGLPCQMHLRSRTLGDNPAYAWMTALLTIMHEPWNSFEVTGVLREIFGISDGDMADFVASHYQDARGRHPLNIAVFPKSNVSELEQVLTLLSQLQLKARLYSLRDFVDHLIAAIDLPSRLAGLGGESFDALLLMLNAVKAQASQAEEQGGNLPAFARSLVDRFNQACDDAAPQEGHIQLLSCHNAKGLEWETVIVPFMRRPIAFANPSYPHCFDLNTSKGPELITSTHAWSGEQKSLRDQSRRYELERLLYVTLTRPKHHLIFIDDKDLEFDERGSFADLLQVLPGQTNADYWDALEAPPILERLTSVSTTPANAPSAIAPSFDWDSARRLADQCMKRATPSSLVAHEPVSSRMAGPSQVETPGTLYGNFWHAMMESAPWDRGLTACADYLNARLAGAPNIERAEREVQAFLASELAALLTSELWSVYCEVPFLWRANDLQCYEGAIDLIACNKETGAWQVLDWKTDSISPKDVHRLIEKYSPQLKIYEQAMASMAKGASSVSCVLYSTVLGEAFALN